MEICVLSQKLRRANMKANSRNCCGNSKLLSSRRLLTEFRFSYSELLTDRLIIESKISKKLIMFVVDELPVEASLKAFFFFHFCLPSSFLGFPFKFYIKKIEVCRYQERERKHNKQATPPRIRMAYE